MFHIGTVTEDAGDLVVTLTNGTVNRFPLPGGDLGPAGEVGFQPIAGAPTYDAQRRILGVVGGALYSTPATEDSRIDRLDGDTWTPVATASGEGHMVRIYGTGDGAKYTSKNGLSSLKMKPVSAVILKITE